MLHAVLCCAGNRSAWSTLFMRPDTVAAAVAAHYGVSKAQLLDSSAEDLPLRMALGEAQVIAQTKAALSDLGVNAKALEASAAASGSAAATKSVARSSSTLLVKNLPYSSDEDELMQLFTGPGRSVLRLALPPTKTLAVVEFAEPQDAR
jgi:multiple RNA-binding domain-containing protein 1